MFTTICITIAFLFGMAAGRKKPKRIANSRGSYVLEGIHLPVPMTLTWKRATLSSTCNSDRSSCNNSTVYRAGEVMVCDKCAAIWIGKGLDAERLGQSDEYLEAVKRARLEAASERVLDNAALLEPIE